MRVSFIVILLSIFYIDGIGQSIPDDSFHWYANPACITEQMDSPVFVKVEIDPVLSTTGRSDFQKTSHDMVENMALDNTINGTIKIKILFHKDEFVMLYKIGVMGLSLSNAQRTLLRDSIEDIDVFTPGKQRGKQVNCIGILYLHIDNAALSSFRCVNFQLRNDL